MAVCLTFEAKRLPRVIKCPMCKKETSQYDRTVNRYFCYNDDCQYALTVDEVGKQMTV